MYLTLFTNQSMHSNTQAASNKSEKHKEFKVSTWPLNSPDLTLIKHLWDVLDNQALSMETPLHNLQDYEDNVLVPYTTAHLGESMPLWVRDVLIAQWGPTQYKAGSLNVMANQCIFNTSRVHYILLQHISTAFSLITEDSTSLN